MIFLFAAVCCLVFVTGCSFFEKKTTQNFLIGEEKLKGKVKSIREITYEVNDEQTELTESKIERKGYLDDLYLNDDVLELCRFFEMNPTPNVGEMKFNEKGKLVTLLGYYGYGLWKFNYSYDSAKSSIDNCDDDPSPYNQSSIVILYEPEINKKILFTGDATCASLIQMINDYPEIRNIDLLKVPHHGSKHNLSSAIIDALKPKTSYISAKGTRKHPSVAIVNYLSKYGNVYSTHKCNGFIRRSQGIERANTKTVEPLKRKQL
ncbi:MAG: hypothetical protein LBR17_00460 [Bacteroidales bacterium]|nr:hypothetical protein [Bacteroidales bacterium]